MARTVSTIERPGSGSRPSRGGGSDAEEGGSRSEQRSSAAGTSIRTAAAAAAAARTTKPPQPASSSSIPTTTHLLAAGGGGGGGTSTASGCSDADYARASSTVARMMPSPSEREPAVAAPADSGHRRAELRHEGSHRAPPYHHRLRDGYQQCQQQPKRGWNGSRGERLFEHDFYHRRGQHYFDDGPVAPSARGGGEEIRRDGSYSHKRDRGDERRRYDDGRWGRERPGDRHHDDRPYHEPCHRPYFSNDGDRYRDDSPYQDPCHREPNHRPYSSKDDRPPHERRSGGEFRGRRDSRDNFIPRKRQKYGNGENHDSSNNRRGHNQRAGGLNRNSTTRRHERPANREEVRSLKRHVAKLEKDIEDLKDSKKSDSNARPASPSGVGAQCAIGAAGHRAGVSVDAPANASHTSHVAVPEKDSEGLEESRQSDSNARLASPSGVGALCAIEAAGQRASVSVAAPAKASVKLEEDMEDVEESKQNESDIHLASSSGAVAQSTIGGVGQRAGVSVGIPTKASVKLEEDMEDMEELKQNESDTRLASSSGAVAQSTIGGVGQRADVSIGTPANASRGDDHDPCFDVSTDEEITFPHASDNDEMEDDGGESAKNHPSAKGPNSVESDVDSVDPLLRDDYDSEGKLAFCCQNCRCWELAETRFMKYSHIRNNCGNSGDTPGLGNTRLYHRGCCHGDKKNDDDYLSPMTRAIHENFDEKKKKSSTVSRIDTKMKIQTSYNTAKREESKFENEELKEANDCCAYSNPVYENYCSNFAQRRKERRSPLRVLDLFSGIGSAAVVLKRLKLPIHSIVHVEHDPVATEVCKFNHKDDGIIHHYVQTFEELYGTNEEADNGKVTAFLDEYGIFDLVLSGAPCQNYSGLNASRDKTSEDAQYLLKVGRLIHKLDAIQMGSMNVKEKVIFLSENVVFKDHERVGKCYSDQEGCLVPICLDAKDFSPCKRYRFYWMNIPVNNTKQIKKIASAVSVDDVLDEGYGAVARLLQSEDEQLRMPVKANAFLASISRIDDDRMIKYNRKKSDDTKYHIETYSVCEREKMMGLPAGYVEMPLRRLFSELTKNAFILPEYSKEGNDYRTFLPREFWHYRRKCSFKFRPNTQFPYFQLALSSPREGRSSMSFYSEEQYCKHLIGNGWSIPVVEHLLEGLKDIFADDVILPTYSKYRNPHPWEPYLSC